MDHYLSPRRSFDGRFYRCSIARTMKRENNEKTRLSARIFSGIFFLIGLSVLVYIGISLGKETYRKRQIQKEIDSLQAQIEDLKQENSEMENLTSYLSSTDFQEKEAREKLNLQKGDEKMIVLRKDVVPQDSQSEDSANAPQVPPEDNTPNWQKWWKHFFEEKR